MPLLEGNQTHPDKGEEGHDGNDNNNTEVSGNQDGGGGGDNNQQDTDETKDESKEKQEQLQQQQVKRTQADGREEKEPFQYPLVGDPPFPIGALDALDEQLNRLRWVVPVLARSDLEQLLRAAINLCRDGAFNNPNVRLCKMIFLRRG